MLKSPLSPNESKDFFDTLEFKASKFFDALNYSCTFLPRRRKFLPRV